MKYIERETLICSISTDDGVPEICRKIENASAADVAPVVHGRWESEKENCPCSVCGIGGVGYWSFCPNCGCKMDGGEKHE